MPKQINKTNKKILNKNTKKRRRAKGSKNKNNNNNNNNNNTKLKNNFILSLDRKRIYELSFTAEYINNKNLLIKHASRTNGFINYKSIGLSKARSRKFITKWYKIEPEEVVYGGGIGFFDDTHGHNRSGRTRALSVEQMWDLFIIYFKTMESFKYGIYTFGENIKLNYNLSRRTIVRYLKVFCKVYKKLKQPHALTPENKKRRNNNCKFWRGLGFEYYKHVCATIDETVVYTEHIPVKLTGFTPKDNINNFDDFVAQAEGARFPRVNKNEYDKPKVPSNPVEEINTWTMPPLPFRNVCKNKYYFIYLFIYLFI